MPKKKRLEFDDKLLEDYMLSNGPPPAKASCIKEDGYFVLACEAIFGTKLKKRFVKALANHYYSNLHRLKQRVHEKIEVMT